MKIATLARKENIREPAIISSPPLLNTICKKKSNPTPTVRENVSSQHLV